MKATDVNFFEKVKAQLTQLENEVSVLSKTKPDNPMNKFKVAIINEMLVNANAILTGDFKPFKNFASFNVDELPTNSDVVVVLSQYLDCLEAFRSAHIKKKDHAYFWNLEDRKDLETGYPSRFRNA